MDKNLSNIFNHKPLIFWYDYSLFGVVLTIGAVISLYVGWISRGEKSKYGYFLARKEMVPFVASMSLLAKYLMNFLMSTKYPKNFILAHTLFLHFISWQLMLTILGQFIYGLHFLTFWQFWQWFTFFCQFL